MVSSGTGRKLRELRRETQHRTVNSDVSSVTPNAFAVTSDAYSGTLCNSSFHWTLYTGLKHRESYKLSSHQTLTSDMSDLISDASGLTSDASDLTSDVSGLYALHETIFNFFPCFHVPTQKCHNTCASVIAFSKIFLSRIQVSTLLDSNAYAQDMDLVAHDSRDDHDFPS